MKKGIIVFSLLLLLVGCSTPAGPAQSNPSDAPLEQSKVVFCSGRDGNVEVYIMNSDGSGQTRLTNSPTFDGAPDISPDGRKIAFLSDRDGNAEIYVMNIDGSDPKNLTNSPGSDTYPDWSPDSQRIVFDSNRDGSSEIYTMNADGTGQTRLTNNSANDYSAKWSHDGKKIAFTSERDGNYEIFTMNADGSSQVNITNNPAIDISPTWSGDNQHLAFDSNRDGHYEIYSMNSDGSNPTRLTISEADRFAYTDWSADGRKILVNVHNGQNWDLYVMDPDGKNITELLGGPTDDIDPRWGPGITSLAGMGRPTITPLPAMATIPNVQPTSVPEVQLPTSAPVEMATNTPFTVPTYTPVGQMAPGSTETMTLTGWVEYFASGTVNLEEDSPTTLGNVILFHDSDPALSGTSSQGKYVLEPAANIRFNVPPEDVNENKDLIFRTGESYEYLIRGYLSDKVISDFFLGNVPVFEVEYLERTK